MSNTATQKIKGSLSKDWIYLLNSNTEACIEQFIGL